MFETLNNIKGGRRLVKGHPEAKRELNKTELNELMLKISRTESFEEVEVHFNRLYDSVVHPLWANLSGKYVPPLSSDDLRDIFQEAWIKVLEQRNKYDGRGDVFNWIYTIKKNMIIDWIRKMKRYEHTSIDEQNDDDEKPDFQFESYEIPLEEKIEEEEKSALLRNTLNNIQDETIKELLNRRIIMDQKLELISQEMGIPLTTVYKKIQKGLSIIKPIVENILTI